jgi:hypothetical protein
MNKNESNLNKTTPTWRITWIFFFNVFAFYVGFNGCRARGGRDNQNYREA